MKRLSIVVPYRGREAHLSQFCPHLRAYFARHKLDHAIPYRVLIVEQESGQLFNRGVLKNIGFQLSKADSDYVCFHDVDYLPIWADYSWTDRPTPIVWFGAEERPIVPGNREASIRHDPETFFGGAVLVPKDLFAQVDGYCNDYWGWGHEDTDLRRRFAAAGIALGRRRGTFRALDHIHEGYKLNGTPTDAARDNEAVLARRWPLAGTVPASGLSTLGYEILSRRPVAAPARPERDAVWEIIKVRFPRP